MDRVIQLINGLSDQHIRVIAGQELIAYKEAGGNRWFVKTSSCSMCGDCCRNLAGNKVVPVDETGACVYLKNNICSLYYTRPFICLWPNTQFECDEKFEEVE